MLAGTEEAGTIHDQSMMSRGGYRPQVVALQFDCGYLSPYFVTHPERMEVTFANVYILITNIKSALRRTCCHCSNRSQSGKPPLIIAGDIGDEAMAMLVVNKLCGPLQVVAVKSPGLGDQRKNLLQDIARFTGGKAVREGFDLQLNNIQISDLGQAERIIIDKNNTVVERKSRDDQRKNTA